VLQALEESAEVLLPKGVLYDHLLAAFDTMTPDNVDLGYRESHCPAMHAEEGNGLLLWDVQSICILAMVAVEAIKVSTPRDQSPTSTCMKLFNPATSPC
jgi:hypothetical protein